MARPRSLTDQSIAAAALAVLGRTGTAELSMRAVAEQLKMSTMALYRYVDSRERLEALVVDFVLSDIDLRVRQGMPWHRQLRQLLLRGRAAVAKHPAVVPLLLTNRHATRGGLVFAEMWLGILAEAGFTGGRRVAAFRALLSYMLGALQVEHIGPFSANGAAALAEFAVADFPHMAAAAKSAARLTPEDEFSQGLELLITGLIAAAAGR